jgi:glycosyltransferase involved in cell wall biosynthesis
MQYLNPRKLQNVVPLGVNVDFYSPLPDAERSRLREKLTDNPLTPIILFVGRMVERKGVHLIRPLIHKHKEWHWVLVGRPDDYNPVEWQSPNLTYLNHASEQELKQLYASADLLVHPSVGEGLTLVVSESLSSGTPVVLSNESLYELSEQDRDLFFGVAPTTNSIEETLIQALADQERLSVLRALCREFALNRLSWTAMASRYSAILAELAMEGDEK